MQRVIDEIKTCFDPKYLLLIFGELGLIYELDLNDDNELKNNHDFNSP